MVEYIVGLDLGQAADYTALAVLERQWSSVVSKDPVFSVRHLRRFPLGTSYTEIVPTVARLTGTPPLDGHATLVVDQTGVGRALVDMLRQAVGLSLIPVTITGGSAVTGDADRGQHVPKKELVTCLQLLLQSQRLKISRSLPEAEALVKELESFRVKITPSAHETFGPWREGQHDDLVVAVALACWWAERQAWSGPGACSWGGRSVIANAPKGVFLEPFREGTSHSCHLNFPDSL